MQVAFGRSEFLPSKTENLQRLLCEIRRRKNLNNSKYLKAKNQYRSNYDFRHKMVFIKNRNATCKLDKRWLGPFKVLENKQQFNCVLVKIVNQKKQTVSYRDIEPYKERKYVVPTPKQSSRP